MARPKKAGLEYFPLETNMFSDIKLRKLIRCQGGKAVTVYVCLLCIIYEKGYYIKWDEDLLFIISERTGYEEAYIQEALKSCLAVGLFNKAMWADGVLTSKGIQLRYSEATLHRTSTIRDYSLVSAAETPVNVAETPVNVAETPVNVAETPVNVAETPQRKEKKSKVNIKKTPIGVKEKATPFQTPTLDEIKSYVEEKGYIVDAERFWNFYESKGWMIGKNKMKNWRAAVVTWQKEEKSRNERNRQRYDDRRGEVEPAATSAKDYKTTF